MRQLLALQVPHQHNMSVIMDAIDQDSEYNVTTWSDRFSTALEVLHNHIQFVTTGT